MHKLISVSFEFLRNCAKGVQVIAMLLVILLMLYWIQSLISADWAWFAFAKQIILPLVQSGAVINSGVIKTPIMTLEIKYAMALVILLAAYGIAHIIILAVNSAENIYNDGRRVVHKIQEHGLNAELKLNTIAEEKKINKYQVLVSTSLKKKFSHKELNVNIDEQNIVMNKFLIEKLGVRPVKFEDGFLYSFNAFEGIDRTIEVLYKLIKSNSYLNYYISIQTVENDLTEANKKIKFLNGLKLENKICMLAETSYRYKYNMSHRYGTKGIGIFQKDSVSYDVFEFVEIL